MTEMFTAICQICENSYETVRVRRFPVCPKCKHSPHIEKNGVQFINTFSSAGYLKVFTFWENSPYYFIEVINGENFLLIEPKEAERMIEALQKAIQLIPTNTEIPAKY